MFCGDTTVATHTGDTVTAHRLKCRSWSCPDCKAIRLRQLRDTAAAGDPSTLITLTVDPSKFDNVNEAAQTLVHAWRMVVQRAKREGKAARIPYLAVFEETKQGWPHLHILARSPYLQQSWLSERMAEYAQSPIVDIRAVKSSRMASRYVAKYVSKGPGRYDGTKRYWKTRDYLVRPTGWERDRPINDADTWFHPIRPESLAYSLSCQGWRVTWSSQDDFSAVAISDTAIDPLWSAWVAQQSVYAHDP